MQIGYMRISKGEQTTALQEDALAKAAVERTYRDVMSGVRDDRPQFQAMLDFARSGDTIVVWRLDRLGRSLKHLIETVMGLQARGINFRSLTEHVDTSTPGGKFTFHLFGRLPKWSAMSSGSVPKQGWKQLVREGVLEADPRSTLMRENSSGPGSSTRRKR